MAALAESRPAAAGQTGLSARTASPGHYREQPAPIAQRTVVGTAPPDPPTPISVNAVLAAVSDVDTAMDRNALRDALAASLIRIGVEFGRLDVCNDSVAALASGTNGLARGIACIAGTGSVCLGLDGLGGEARTGGWGPPFGDGGSGYWIGFHAIARALELHDGDVEKVA